MSRRSAPGDAVDAVVADLASRLPGGGVRTRGSLLQEAHDGLRDAAEAYQQQGCSPAEAARRAAEDFGDPGELAASYADDVLRSEGRRTSTVLAGGYLLILAAWALLGTATTHPGGNGQSHWAAAAFGLLGVLAAAVAAGVFLLSRRRARTGRVGGVVASVAGVAGLVCGGVSLLASYLVQPWGSRASATAPVSSWTAVVEALSASVVALILLLSVRCLATVWRASRLRCG
ncbi:hypothetical protein GCM10009616_24900 [Microlunatus lacustris]